MVWNSAADFFAMGGYGLYVWGSFGVTAAVLAAEVWSLAARRRRLRLAATHAMLEESDETPN